MLKNSANHYGSISKIFHWIMAIILLGMLPFGYIMTSLSSSDFKFSLYDLHKAIGLLFLALVALRLLWRSLTSKPALPASIPQWQRQIADWNITVLYLLMFLMPISGFLMSVLGGHEVSFFGLFTIQPFTKDKIASSFFNETHYVLSFLLIAAFVMHLAGALYHHYILKDEVLKRMWKSKRKQTLRGLEPEQDQLY